MPSLEDLPLRVREIIWRYALLSDQTMNAECLLTHRVWPLPYISLSLLRVSPSIRQEALRQFFLHNKFSLLYRSRKEFDAITSKRWCNWINHLELILTPDVASDIYIVRGLVAFTSLKTLEIKTNGRDWPATTEFDCKVLRVLGWMKVSQKITFSPFGANSNCFSLQLQGHLSRAMLSD